METIEMAALMYPKTGLILTMGRPAHHKDIQAAFTHPHAKFSKKGFITNKGRFVGRKEGFTIAMLAGQYRETEHTAKAMSEGKLHSENVW